MGGSTAVLALVLLIVGSTTDGGGERGVRRRGAGALPPPALVRDGEIVVTFPIADGLQPGDFPTRRYQELLAGSGLAQPDAAAPGSGGAEERSAKSERSGTPDEPRESASGPSLRALMREWGQVCARSAAAPSRGSRPRARAARVGARRRLSRRLA